MAAESPHSHDSNLKQTNLEGVHSVPTCLKSSAIEDADQSTGRNSVAMESVQPLPSFSTGYFQNFFGPGYTQPLGPLPPIDCKPTLAANIDPEIAKSIENIAKVSFNYTEYI